MMIENLYTKVKLPEYPIKIDHTTPTLWIGSCFTENIGQKLKELCFNVKINPFGIIYNPLSIFKTIEFISLCKMLDENVLVYHDGLYHSIYHHGCFSNISKDECLKNINQEIQNSHEYLKKTKYLLITFGTSFVYYYKEKNEIVANCHKLPSDFFYKKLLRIDDIIESFDAIYDILKKVNSELKIILTLSPVRHINDGLIENQVSKSILRVAINHLENKYGDVFYFPAYEIMLDELRDYRFYDSDMVHPSSLAVDYIFDKFSLCFFDPQTIEINEEITKLIKLFKHKPLHPERKDYKTFIDLKEKKLFEIKKKYPYIDFSIFDSFQ